MESFIQIGRFILPLLGAAVIFYSLFSLFRKRGLPETGAYLQNSANGDQIQLYNKETSIGRGKSCDIVLNYDTVSRSHAVIAPCSKGWFIVDTRSSTGTYVNGEPAKGKVFLEDRDIITLGGASLVFYTGGVRGDIPIAKKVT